MKAFVCSDLHLEHEHKIKFPKADAIIIAGDFTYWKYLQEDIKKVCDIYKEVIFVAGNHEFYGASFSETENVLSNIQLSNFHWLENKEVKIGSTRIIGTTLWYPNNPDNIMYERWINDFSYIRNFRAEVYQRNTKAIEYLSSVDMEDAIVVTHHLPSFYSVAPEYFRSRLNRFFVCDLHNLILEKNPKMWIHGHTHNSFGYMIGNTKILCNPLGYPFEHDTGYSKKVIIEL